MPPCSGSTPPPSPPRSCSSTPTTGPSSSSARSPTRRAPRSIRGCGWTPSTGPARACSSAPPPSRWGPSSTASWPWTPRAYPCATPSCGTTSARPTRPSTWSASGAGRTSARAWWAASWWRRSPSPSCAGCATTTRPRPPGPSGVLLPHDYLSLHLSQPGTAPFTDRGDASGTGYYSTVGGALATRARRLGPRARAHAPPAGGRGRGGRAHPRRRRGGRAAPATTWPPRWAWACGRARSCCPSARRASPRPGPGPPRPTGRGR